MIGDSLSDIEAGVRLGMRTVLIADQQHQRATGMDSAFAQANARAGSLLEWVEHGFG